MASRRRLIDSFDPNCNFEPLDNCVQQSNGRMTATSSTMELEEWLDSRMVSDIKRIFHSERKLLIYHPNLILSEEEIRGILSSYLVTSVQLHCPGISRAAIVPVERLEDFHDDQVIAYNGCDILLRLMITESFLCIAHLPLTFTEEQFKHLVQSHGRVKRCFLMINEKTGASKGYGFVEYADKTDGYKAKLMTNGRLLENSTLFCDWLEPRITKFKALHSKCLYVDQLPKGFRNMDELRQLVSNVATPSYCQIALKNGLPQDWALVELNSSEDAEKVHAFLDGSLLHSERIRASFSMPGLRAINLYDKVLSSEGRSKVSGLLPTPTLSSIMTQFQNVEKQNPLFAQSIRNIMNEQTVEFCNKVNSSFHLAGPKSTAPLNASNGRPLSQIPREITPLSCITANNANHLNVWSPFITNPPQYSHDRTSTENWKFNQEQATVNSPKKLRTISSEIKLPLNSPPIINNPCWLSNQPCWSPPKVVAVDKPGLLGWSPDHPLLSQSGLVSPVREPILKLMTSPPPFSGPAPGCITPIGQKRKINLRLGLPSPEPSPEGNYIGQHSQGLGGHYADSYRKRFRKL